MVYDLCIFWYLQIPNLTPNNINNMHFSLNLHFILRILHDIIVHSKEFLIHC